MGRLIKYEHRGIPVNVDEDLKGKHREHCLCYRCERFHPDKRNNCPIARRLFNICVLDNLVTPVYECSVFEEKEKS